MSLRVAKMHIGRIYNQYIKFFEHSNSPVVDFTDGEKTKNISLPNNVNPDKITLDSVKSSFNEN